MIDMGKKAMAGQFEALAASIQAEALEKAKSQLMAQMNTADVEARTLAAMERMGQIEVQAVAHRQTIRESEEELAMAEAELKMEEGYLACKNEDQRKAWLVVNGPKNGAYAHARASISLHTSILDGIRLDLNAAEREYQTYRDLLKLRTAQLEFLAR